ncbi:MAG: hypothetical protein WD638_10560 [Nitriliruptoraceae bacterium]
MSETTGTTETTAGTESTAKERAQATAEKLKAAGEQRLEAIKAEAERAKNTVDEVKQEVSAALDERRGGGATSVEDAERKAAALRAGLERDLQTLGSRLPDPADLTDRARTIAIGAAGTLATVAGVIVVAGRRRAKTVQEREITEQAEALAAALGRIQAAAADGGQDAPGRWGRRLVVLAGAAGAGAAVWQRRRGFDEVDEDLWGPPAT